MGRRVAGQACKALAGWLNSKKGSFLVCRRETTAQTPESSQLSAAGSSSARPNIRPDAFVGDTYSIAAKKYLKQVGYAVSVDELVDILKKGGCPVGGVDPRKTLYISLVRDVRTFYPIPGKMGFIGLREFYPNLKGKKPGRPKKQ